MSTTIMNTPANTSSMVSDGVQEAHTLGPNDVQRIFECLQGCLQTDISIRQQAEELLHEFETHIGFASCLMVCNLRVCF